MKNRFNKIAIAFAFVLTLASSTALIAQHSTAPAAKWDPTQQPCIPGQACGSVSWDPTQQPCIPGQACGSTATVKSAVKAQK